MLQMAERQGVEIDFCPRCRGVWLDRGELDKIIERSTAEIYSKPGPKTHEERYDRHYEKHHDKHHDLHDSYKHHGKRSFLQDLFD
jgi:Zn-finger nucleic acid-binding protein